MLLFTDHRFLFQILLIKFVLLILRISLFGILNLVHIALFLFLGHTFHLIIDEVASASDLLQHVGRNFILIYNFAIDGDFFDICKFRNNFFPLLFRNLAFSSLNWFVKHSGLAVNDRAWYEREPYCFFSVKVFLTHFNNEN